MVSREPEGKEHTSSWSCFYKQAITQKLRENPCNPRTLLLPLFLGVLCELGARFSTPFPGLVVARPQCVHRYELLLPGQVKNTVPSQCELRSLPTRSWPTRSASYLRKSSGTQYFSPSSSPGSVPIPELKAAQASLSTCG